jgi:hypothetical protein
MVKCNKDQVERLKKALKREKDSVVRQRIQMVLLREDGKTQPQIAELTDRHEGASVNAISSDRTAARAVLGGDSSRPIHKTALMADRDETSHSL